MVSGPGRLGETATLLQGECPPDDAPPEGSIEVVCAPPVGEYTSPVSYGGGVCTLDRLELELGRPMLATGVSTGTPPRMVGRLSRGGGSPTRGDSIEGELSGTGVKGWLRGRLSIASIVSP